MLNNFEKHVEASQANICLASLKDPLVDDGAMYSGLGENQLDLFFRGRHWHEKLDDLSRAVASTPYWSYGPLGHSSAARNILGSIMLLLSSVKGQIIEIRHLVIQREYKWVIGGNVFSYCDNMHLQKLLVFKNGYCIPTYTKENL